MNDAAVLQTYRAEEAHAGLRIDAFLGEVSSLSRSAAAKLIEQGKVTLSDGSLPNKKTRLRAGDEVCVALPPPTADEALPEDIPLPIVYEDDHIVVINKPVGMVVHPAAGNESGTLVNALLHHCGSSLSGIGGVLRPGIVHRIDKDTGGLIAVAKHDAAHLALSEQLKDHSMGREYDAIAIGNLREDHGTIDAPIGRHPTDRKKMAVLRGSEHAREARTHYTVTERFSLPAYGSFCRIRCVLETGRTHQIRVHMASIGHPLLGDPLYGGNKTALEAAHRALIHGQCLHATALHLRHPASGEQMDFSAPLPEETETLLRLLRTMSM